MIRPRLVGRKAVGFTLIEVLVAFAILAVSLGIAFEIFSTGLRSGRAAGALATATLHAESKLETLGVEEKLQEGATTGNFGDGYRWRVAVRRFETGPEGVDAPTLPDAFAVAVTVWWKTPGGEASVVLDSLRLQPR